MKIPISAKVRDNKISIYRNNTVEYLPAPFKNYILLDKNYFNSEDPGSPWTQIPQNKITYYVKKEFNTDQLREDFISDLNERKPHMYRNSHIDQIFIQEEDFFLNYPHDKPLKILYYDIEVMTHNDGFFPKPISHPILCIGYSIWLFDNDGNGTKIKSDIITSFDEIDKDFYLIKTFFDTIKEEDPDVIAGYNSLTFDTPYLIDRAKINSIDLSSLCRNGKDPFIAENGDIHLTGRIHFDIYNSNAGVSKDQTIYGVKDRTLKTMSNFYKGTFKITIESDIENTYGLWKDNRQLLFDYQEDDVLRTEHVGNIYIRNCIALAEMNKVPLNNIMNMNSSFVPKIYIARNMYKRKLINTFNTNFKYGK